MKSRRFLFLILPILFAHPAHAQEDLEVPGFDLPETFRAPPEDPEEQFCLLPTTSAVAEFTRRARTAEGQRLLTALAGTYDAGNIPYRSKLSEAAYRRVKTFLLLVVATEGRDKQLNTAAMIAILNPQRPMLRVREEQWELRHPALAVLLTSFLRENPGPNWAAKHDSDEEQGWEALEAPLRRVHARYGLLVPRKRAGDPVEDLHRTGDLVEDIRKEVPIPDPDALPR